MLWLEILKQKKPIQFKNKIMIQATIIPQKTDVNFSFPKDYIGKKVHAIFYIEDEISQMPNAVPSKKPSDFFGTLSAEEGEKMHLHATQTRNEWDRNI
jgi:putative transposon-encoded protein